MKNFIKYLAIIIAFSMLLSSCSVYYKKEVTFNEAYQSKAPVRLVTNQDKKVHLKKIILQDTTYYGVYYHDGKKITFPLSKENYTSVRLKDRATSTFITVAGSVVTAGIVAIVVVAITISNSSWEWKTTNYNSAN